LLVWIAGDYGDVRTGLDSKHRRAAAEETTLEIIELAVTDAQVALVVQDDYMDGEALDARKFREALLD